MTALSSLPEIIKVTNRKGADKMKTWKQLFIRHGWLLQSISENEFVTSQESKENIEFLLESLKKANVDYFYDGKQLLLKSRPISEQKWINVLSFEGRGRTESIGLFNEDAPILRQLDTYISGIVRQLNRLGFKTIASCDGHNRRSAHVMISNETSIQHLVELLRSIGFQKVYYREGIKGITLYLPYNIHQAQQKENREKLLLIAEKLSIVEKDWLDKGHSYIREQLFYHELEEVLNIPGSSGNEEEIRQFVIKQIRSYVDYLTIDRYGNILAEKTYRSGNGPTILLNAHLDTVEEIVPDRTILKNGAIWSSSDGILGADDRAGVAILIHLAKYLRETSFHGKVKFIFTVEEEIGLVGARHIDEYFLWGVDGAIVCDRRGTNDIVISCGRFIPFCDESYCKFFEEVANKHQLGNWKCTAGGSSDTKIWAEHGIQSVNLSVGYSNEHTDDEFLNVTATYNTVQLLLKVFEEAKLLQRMIRTINRSKKLA